MKAAMLVVRIVAACLLLLGYAAAYFRFKQGTYLIREAVLYTVLLLVVTAVFAFDWIRSRRASEKKPGKKEPGSGAAIRCRVRPRMVLFVATLAAGPLAAYIAARYHPKSDAHFLIAMGMFVIYLAAVLRYQSATILGALLGTLAGAVLTAPDLPRESLGTLIGATLLGAAIGFMLSRPKDT